MSILSCTFTFNKLTKKLFEENEKAFEYNRVNGWLNLIQKEHMYPYQWNNPTRNGLVAKCKPIESKEEYKLRIEELKLYVNSVNSRLSTDIIFEIDNTEPSK